MGNYQSKTFDYFIKQQIYYNQEFIKLFSNFTKNFQNNSPNANYLLNILMIQNYYMTI